MRDGGRLVIATENERVVGHEDLRIEELRGDYVVLVVSDTGAGIPAEIQDRVFEPFFTTKGVGEGTGLGLASVYAIVKKHGGFVRLQSREGQGTTFRVYLPVAAEDEDGKEGGVEEAVSLPGGNETILLAEDESQVRNLTISMLEGAGYRVIAAADGAEALALFEAHADEIDMALLDVVMPKMSGRAVYDALREKVADLPVLFASGYSADALNDSHISVSQTELISKPYSRGELLRRVRVLLNGRRR